MALSAVALALPVSLLATTVGPLTVFSNGTVADADQVNANFEAMRTAIDDNAARLGAITDRVQWTTRFTVSGSDCVPASGSTAYLAADPCTRAGTGDYTVHFAPGLFAEPVACTFIALVGSGAGGPRLTTGVTSPRATSHRVFMWVWNGSNFSNKQDQGFAMTCDGRLAE
jgi:hypothetical protein